MEPKRFFIAGARPVKFLPLPDGGLAIRMMDMTSGVFVYGMEMYSLCLSSDPNVDEVSEDEFIQFVELKRSTLYRGDDELGGLYRRLRDAGATEGDDALARLVHRSYAMFQARHPDEGP